MIEKYKDSIKLFDIDIESILKNIQFPNDLTIDTYLTYDMLEQLYDQLKKSN